MRKETKRIKGMRLKTITAIEQAKNKIKLKSQNKIKKQVYK